MISSGIRLGAWDYLKWKHIVPIENERAHLSDQLLFLTERIQEIKRKQSK
jgi:hypothetical protein